MKTMFKKIKLRSLITALAIATLLAIPVFYNNCGGVQFVKLYGATSVGNPFSSTQSSSEILFAICSVLDRCGAQVPFNVCMSGVASTNGIGQRLGLAPGVDDPYSSLENAENSGLLIANLPQANTCVDTINNLNCTDPNVVNAYNASSSSPFAATQFMVPMNACGQVFIPPVQSYACITKVFLRGNMNTNLAPSISGAGFSYSVNPSLPAGLSIDPATGIISGTPTVVTPMTAYTVTALGPSGSSYNVVNIRTADGYIANDLTDSAFVGPGASCVSASGSCNLRSAIQASINSGSSRAIVVSPGTSTLGLGSLNITSSMDIYGDCAQGTTIDGNATGRIFDINNSGAVSLNNLTIQNALLNNAGAGGGARIRNTGIATFTVGVNNCTFQNNIISGNTWNDQGAAIDAEGNNTIQQLILNISDSIFQNNRNADTMGEAIISFTLPGVPGTTQGTIDRSSFISNTTAYNQGGTIWYESSSLTISNSLFYNNTAPLAGVLVYNLGATNAVNFINDTFDSNSATANASAGVMAVGGTTGVANFTNCTFANNVGVGGGVSRNITGGNLANNLFYNNGPINCNVSTMSSLGGNLSDHGAADCNLTQSTDIVNTNALLGPLQNNGGPTQTMALLPGSPGGIAGAH